MVRQSMKLLRKTTWYPQPHEIRGGVTFEADDAALDATCVPIAFHDEGLGTPSARETHPENAAFTVPTDEANCFPDSRVNNVFAEFRYSITSKFMDDNLTGIRCWFMPVFFSFLDDYTPADELTSATVQSILKMQTESTDRQGGPLYVATTDLPEKVAAMGVLGTNTPFLDTDTGIESIAAALETYYDAIHYYTIANKVRSVTGGMKWFTLTRNRPQATFRFHIRPKSKRMNPYTYFGIQTGVPIQGSESQIPVVTRDLTVATQYVDLDWKIRYNEWNENFDFRKVSA